MSAEPSALLTGMTYLDLCSLLVAAIPKHELDELLTWKEGKVINGGTVRRTTTPIGIVATYNNTRESKDDILRWFRDARALAAARGE